MYSRLGAHLRSRGRLDPAAEAAAAAAAAATTTPRRGSTPPLLPDSPYTQEPLSPGCASPFRCFSSSSSPSPPSSSPARAPSSAPHRWIHPSEMPSSQLPSTALPPISEPSASLGVRSIHTLPRKSFSRGIRCTILEGSASLCSEFGSFPFETTFSFFPFFFFYHIE